MTKKHNINQSKKTEQKPILEPNRKLLSLIYRRMRAVGIDSQRGLSKISGVNRSEISNIFTGRRTKPTIKTLEKLYDALGGSRDELLDAAGYLLEREIITATPESIKPTENIAILPIIGIIRAGQPIYAEENIAGYAPAHPDFVRSGEYFFLKVIGDSMKDSGMNDGSLALVRRQESVENGEIAVVMVDQDNATVKRVYYNNGTNFITLKPDNPLYNPRTYPAENISIIGKVVRVFIDPNKRKRW